MLPYQSLLDLLGNNWMMLLANLMVLPLDNVHMQRHPQDTN